MEIAEVFGDLPTLETERLILRKARVEDAADRFAYSSDPEVAHFMVWDPATDIGRSQEGLRYLANLYREGHVAPWAVEHRQDRRMIGMVGYASWLRRDARAEVSYVLNRRYWHQGFCTEAMRAVLRFGFERMELNRVEALISPDNHDSRRVAERLGMREEGRLRQVVRVNGQMRDHLMYSILKSEWIQTQPAPTR